MEEQGILLEKASFSFSQDANCLSDSDQYESIEIEACSSLGIDRDGGCFFVLKTEKWSVDSVEDLEEIFDRIRKVVKNNISIKQSELDIKSNEIDKLAALDKFLPINFMYK